MKRWAIVVGARPQFVKAAVLWRAVERRNAVHPDQLIQLEIIHTGQHYDHGMSQVFFDEMEIPPPAINLDAGQSFEGSPTQWMHSKLKVDFAVRKPELVITVGDTNSTLAGAYAAGEVGIPSAHVEAGMRSFNRKMPEEFNRIFADHASDYLFCASDTARRNLKNENIRENVYFVGDVMYDAVLYYKDKAIEPDHGGPFVLLTLHRKETLEDGKSLKNIFESLARSPWPVIFPIHPHTKNIIGEMKLDLPDCVTLIDPISYFSMLGHIRKCAYVVTDSGGLQKEAYYLGKKCVTVRTETEWVELEELNVNCVCGTDPKKLRAAMRWGNQFFEPKKNIKFPYGTGDAGQMIVDILAKKI